MSKRYRLGSLAIGALAALLGACSSDAGLTGSPPPAAELSGLTIASTSPGEDLYGPNASSFASCKLVHVDGSSFSADPQFVLELPDTIGAHYGLTDGYSIPFPTPWIYDPT